MKRLAILGVIACLALLVGSAAVVGGPAGPPDGLDVNVANEPGVTVLNDDTNPVPVAVQSGGPPVFRFVGVTETLTTGRGPGPIGMNSKCEAEFPGARMCTSKEFFETGITVEISERGWIHPSVAHIERIERADGDMFFVITTETGQTTGTHEYPPNVTPDNITFNCANWNAQILPFEGTTIGTSGRLSMRVCTSSYPIICCAPSGPSP